jgi:hypothetical protein
MTGTRGIGRRLSAALIAMQAFFWQAAAALQQPDVQVDIDANGGGTWYTTWWVWVLIAVFIIIIVALTSRGRTREG